jgi:hypothetical protein
MIMIDVAIAIAVVVSFSCVCTAARGIPRRSDCPAQSYVSAPMRTPVVST